VSIFPDAECTTCVGGCACGPQERALREQRELVVCETARAWETEALLEAWWDYVRSNVL